MSELPIEVDPQLLGAVIRATRAGFQMAGIDPRPVGCSTAGPRGQEIAVVVGLVGRRNGTVTLHLSRPAVLYVAGRFLGAEVRECTAEVFDAAAEVANIVAGRLKGELGGERYGITHISCPSMIVGADYHVHSLRGFGTVSVEFEIGGLPMVLSRERLISTTVGLSQGPQ